MKSILNQTKLIGLFVIVLGVLFVSQDGTALAADKVWTGGGSDNKFSTAANWSPSGAPVAGDNLKFDNFTVSDPNHTNSRELNNDLDLVFGNVSTTSEEGVDTYGNDNEYYSVNEISVAAGALLSGTGKISVYFEQLTTEGDITIANNVGARAITAENVVMTGETFTYQFINTQSITVKSGASLSSAVSPSSQPFVGLQKLTVEQGASMEILGQDKTLLDLTADLYLGGGTGTAPVIRFARGAGGADDGIVSSPGINISGDIVLSSDANINVSQNVATYSGQYQDNGHTLTFVIVGSKAYLRGAGILGRVTLEEGGTIAPGNSPGILTVLGITWTENSAYEVEFAGKELNQYDQTKVIGDVTLGSAILKPTLLDGYIPIQGTSYVIIDNDGGGAVNGTFKGLAEGATVSIGDTPYFTITYKGGDGNDVVLTAIPGVGKAGQDNSRKNAIITLIITGLSIATAATVLHKKRVIKNA